MFLICFFYVFEVTLRHSFSNGFLSCRGWSLNIFSLQKFFRACLVIVFGDNF